MALVADSDSDHSDTLFNATSMSENEVVNNKILSCLSIQRVSHTVFKEWFIEILFRTKFLFEEELKKATTSLIIPTEFHTNCTVDDLDIHKFNA